MNANDLFSELLAQLLSPLDAVHVPVEAPDEAGVDVTRSPLKVDGHHTEPILQRVHRTSDPVSTDGRIAPAQRCAVTGVVDEDRQGFSVQRVDPEHSDLFVDGTEGVGTEAHHAVELAYRDGSSSLVLAEGLADRVFVEGENRLSVLRPLSPVHRDPGYACTDAELCRLHRGQGIANHLHGGPAEAPEPPGALVARAAGGSTLRPRARDGRGMVMHISDEHALQAESDCLRDPRADSGRVDPDQVGHHDYELRTTIVEGQGPGKQLAAEAASGLLPEVVAAQVNGFVRRDVDLGHADPEWVRARGRL